MSLASRIEFSDRAKKDIGRLDPPIAKRIRAFLHTRLIPINDPRSLGEALRGSTLGTYWKYPVGDSRIIAHIEDDVLRIVFVRVANRREVYRQWQRPTGYESGGREFESLGHTVSNHKYTQ